MRIAIDVSPVSKSSTSAHKVRGVGSYINLLINNLPRYDKKNEYVFVEDDQFPEVDLIHYPYFDPFFITLPNVFQVKTVVTVHDLTPLVFPEHFPSGFRGKLKWFTQRSRLKKVDLIITDSDCSKKDVENIVGISKERIQTVYLAAGEQFGDIKSENLKLKTRKKFSLPEKFLLYVGDATWNKNLPQLIDAVKKTKYKLVLVGKVWSDESSNLHPWNKDLHLVRSEIKDNDQFLSLGFVSDEDLVAIYNLASVLVMPSIYEGFGLPVLEAMKSGCPVICSRGGSLPEVAGDAAVYIGGLNSDNILPVINNVMQDTSLKEKMSRLGFAQARKFTIEKSMNNLIRAYENT